MDKGITIFTIICRRVPLLLIALACLVVAIAAARNRIYFAEFEHVEVTYWNRKYFAYVNISARRYSRRDPTHYLSAHFETLMPMGDNVTIDWYLYEFLSNEYRRSFVEALGVKLCEIVLVDKFVGPYFREKLDNALKTCPFPKAVYHLENGSIPNMPLLATFPFQKGRLYINWTLTHPNGVKENLGYGHADSLIKSRNIFADFEHTEVSYWNRKYLAHVNASARRYNRRDPTHYINAHFETLVPLGDNVTIDWYVYEFLSNEYRRSFVEGHGANICHVVLRGKIIGPYIREKLNNAYKICPFPKAVYHLENISITNMPLLATFPFQKGRVYVNWTITHPDGAKEILARGQVDAVIKTRRSQ